MKVLQSQDMNNSDQIKASMVIYSIVVGPLKQYFT